MQIFVFVCFFVSGFASLVFEIVWDRSLAAVFGGTSLALSTLLTAFMFGLALGSWIGGKVAMKVDNPFRLYGAIEIFIGVFALLTPTLFSFLPVIYKPWFEWVGDVPFVFHVGRFVVAFTVLCIPTVLMGMTLPLLSQFVAQSGSSFRAKVGLLYGVNTVGACLGCFLAGFVLLPNLGLTVTNTAFALVDIVVGLAVIAVSFAARRTSDTPADDDQELSDIGPFHASMWLWVAVACSGFVSMALQVLWTRAYLIVLGSSTYSFSLVLTSFLMGLGTGSVVGAAVVERRKAIDRSSYLRVLGVSQTLLVVGAAAATGFLDYLPTMLFERSRESIGSANEIYLFQFGLVALLVFVPLLLQGMMFPLVVAAISNSRDSAGRVASRVYGVNTVGAIVGSFSAGFVLLPTFGLQSSLQFALGVGTLVALTFVGIATAGKVRAVSWVVTLALALLAIGFGSRIDRAELTRGMFRTVWARELFDPKKFAKDRPELLFAADGSNATITVEKRGKLVTLKSNGKPEASSGADMATQILVAQIPMLVRAESQKRGGEEVAMIGYGSGVTAGAALQWPLRRLVVAEIEPEMIEAAEHFAHVNHRPDRDDRTEIVAADGRNFLALDDTRWDVIVSEPSNPWIAGVSSLFTTEHFELVRSRLKKDGVFAQWVQLYEIHPDNVRDIVRTFVDVFPNAYGFSSMPKGTDLILVASQNPIHLTENFADQAWQDDITRAELQRAGIVEPSDLIGLMFWNRDELVAFADGGVANTDDNLRLEFSAPRDLVRYDLGRSFFSKRYFSKSNYGDPTSHLREPVESWSVESKAALARGLWRGGKRQFSSEFVAQWTRDEIDPEFRDLVVAHHAATLDLSEAIRSIWPEPNSEWHARLVGSDSPDQWIRMMGYLEQDGVPRRGFSGEKGLVYAYTLFSLRYYKHALRQIEGLSDDDVSSTPMYQLLKGNVLEKRRRYGDSYDAFLNAGRALNAPR